MQKDLRTSGSEDVMSVDGILAWIIIYIYPENTCSECPEVFETGMFPLYRIS